MSLIVTLTLVFIFLGLNLLYMFKEIMNEEGLNTVLVVIFGVSSLVLAAMCFTVSFIIIIGIAITFLF